MEHQRPPTDNSTVLLHQLLPAQQSNKWKKQWSAFLRTWRQPGVRVLRWRDADLQPLVRRAFPHLAARIGRMRTPIERVDMARYALLYLYGGVYADADVALLSLPMLRCAIRDAELTLPWEKERLIGQSIMISRSPRHPFWASLAKELVARYNRACYEPDNTGPDALTRAWPKLCLDGPRTPLRLHRGLLAGPVALHGMTGAWRNQASVARRKGRLGCPSNAALPAMPRQCVEFGESCGSNRSLALASLPRHLVTPALARERPARG